MSVNYSILANNPVWNGNTEVSAETAVATTSFAAVPMSTSQGVARTVTISNVGSVNLFLTNDTSQTSGILLQPGCYSCGVAGAPLSLYNAHAATAGAFVLSVILDEACLAC